MIEYYVYGIGYKSNRFHFFLFCFLRQQFSSAKKTLF